MKMMMMPFKIHDWKNISGSKVKAFFENQNIF